MGMQLKQTVEMGDIATEVRSRSAYVYGNGVFLAENGVIEIDFTDVDKLRSALDQIAQHFGGVSA